ncbi:MULTISPECIES: DUF4230 domain-containing protein [unclassified Streptomyces]|uniref:DUF4230 domain-containing protein n=1 Tax=unclassified Streptomyces TaxID=2593676 RepID=UPI00081B485B|nr:MULTISPECIES: DUF4230 domain-containing protein [unclassified Streptomyces]MYQ52466.1 DUF4230 domain-containing protein [Streptomyces sp. SID4941]SCD82973.1 Protein of unknown function [Streptomyces sp. PalvLS-984]SDC34491.1 Protein of unknown function [Streptomyces sp. AmelKG-A3]
MTSTDVKTGGTPDPDAAGGSRRPARTRGCLPFAGVCAVALALLLVGSRVGLLPGFGDLFGERTTDRSGPAVLKAVQDMSAYQAASGDFQVVVDLEKDTKFLPDAVRGTRTLYVGAGTVAASVDLGGVAEDGVKVDEDRTEAELRLPHAVLSKPALDPDRSYAVSKQRGLLDRLGDLFSDNPGSEQAVNKLAARRIAEAAEESGLTTRAEKNTTSMLQGLLGSLGFEKVTVRYGDPSR